MRRRRLLAGGVLLAVLAICVFAVAGHPHNDSHHANLSGVEWPARGQAALVVGNGKPAASPDEQPVPIASVAKVMTAYLVLKRDPLSGTQDGFTVSVTAAQARAEAQDASEDQSVAAVAPGERLTERQLLEALLIPSGNNIAWMLAAKVAGSATRFIAEMNAQAQVLGMDHTTYTDPSGWNQGTVSTAADQLRVFRQAIRFSVFRQIVSMGSVTLPVAGTLTNTNPLIGDGYAGKTGSDSAAGACLAFFTHVTVGGHRQTAAGVVLGQWEADSSSVVLAAAGQAAEQLVDSVAPAEGVSALAASAGAGQDATGERGRPATAAPGAPLG